MEIQKGDILSARLTCFRGISNFYFRTKILTDQEHFLLNETRNLTYGNGQLIYAARPYTTGIGQIKLYLSDREIFERCLVEDLFTKNIDGQLVFHVSIRIIDYGRYFHGVNINRLYDFPKALEYFKDIEPEAKRAMIWLGKPFPKNLRNPKIDDYSRSRVISYKEMFKIKIVDYDEDTNIYHVDLIDKSQKSFIQHLKEKFDDILIKLESKPISSETNVTRGNIKKLAHQSCRTFKPMLTTGQAIKRFNGIIQYYKKQLKIPLFDTNTYFRGKFFRVRLISWSRPDSFYIIPDDHNYFHSHDAFQRELLRLHEFDYDKEQMYYDQEPFQVGDKCWFINNDNPNIGKWLRGIIETVPSCKKFGENGFEHQTKYDFSPDELDEFVASSRDFCYIVRSIDFGFSAFRTTQNLRRIQNKSLFHRRGPWALKCHLFGIDVLQHEVGNKSFSPICLDFFDGWCRDSIKNGSGGFSPFYVLFKDDLLKMSDSLMLDDTSIGVTFFNRVEKPYTLEDSVMRRADRIRFESLNVQLMEKGLVGDFMHKENKSSSVELDEYVINQLVYHDKMELY